MLRLDVAEPALQLPRVTSHPAVPHLASRLLRTLGLYLSLAKPRIILLLLVTTVPAMILAAGGMPPPWLVLVTLLGGALAAGGANAINCYLDRDIDGVMSRTRSRPLPSGQVAPKQAVLFGSSLGALAFVVLAVGANLLAAALALGALAFYVFVYTLWLKRVSPQNIVIGGAAGAMPPLVGWAAVSGHLAWPAAVLFLIIFLWTPPHFWALALRYRSDYERAGVPMLPVVRGREEAQRQIFVYSLLLVGSTLLLVPAGMGWLYLGAALLLGTPFIWLARRLCREGTARAATALFKFSVLYLGLLFVAMAVDRLAWA